MPKFTHADLIAQGYVWDESTRSFERPSKPIEPRKASNPAKAMSFDPSPLEALFLSLWQKCGGPELIAESLLVPGRKFRCDFLHKPTKSVIEIQGFRDHTSAKGFKRDNEKHLLLFLHGYQVVTLDRAQITQENLTALVSELLQRNCP